jgi:hypothetical protein
MFWKLVISALVLPISIGFSSTAAQASANSKDSFLNETHINTSDTLGTAADSSQLIATNHCSYGHRSHHGGHGHGGHHKNSFGGHGGHGGHHKNSFGGHGGHHNNSFGHGGGHGHGGHHNSH